VHVIASLVLALVQSAGSAPQPELRVYEAWLTTPGGPLRFGLELGTEPGRPTAFLVNGAERIAVPRVELDGEQVLLELPHYDARIRATVLGADGIRLSGTWEKRRGKEEVARVPFDATLASAAVDATLAGGAVDATPASGAVEPGSDALPQGQREPLTGRWEVKFWDGEPAVAVLEQRGTSLAVTFLTPTGDYRYLAGTVRSEEISSGCMADHRITFTLSCFDGAHAFLFDARLVGGRLYGDFHSGNWYHDTWKAERDDSAALDDPFAQTRWNGTTKLADLVFPDLDGVPRNLADFAGDATLLVVFGSWCPNCHDEARLLAELDRKYRARGLRILMLAFELTGERERDAAQVRIFQERHGLELPFFLGGTADKAAATEALGLVDRVRAFPTTVFVGADGLPRAIHSGFAGPATGDEHAALVREFEQRIEALLAR
jgi:thiol-disulfide isomerase/thioredoxin